MDGWMDGMKKKYSWNIFFQEGVCLKQEGNILPSFLFNHCLYL